MSRAPIVALSVLAALFLATAGTFTALYLGQRSETDRLATAATAERSTAADLAREQEEADKSLADRRSSLSGLESEHDLLTQCVDATKAYFKLPAGDSPESQRLFEIMYDTCPRI